MGDQVRAIIQAGSPGGKVDQRLHEVRAATGLSEGIGSSGGFLLQSDFSYDLIRGAFDTGFLASKTTKFTVGANKNSIELPAIDETSRAAGSRWGGIRLYHVAEADEKTASQPKFRKLELNLQKLVGLVYVTDELMWDVPTLEQILRQGFAEEYGYELDNMILNGTGVAQGLGVLNSGSLVTQTAEGGQGATLIWDNIRKMWSRLLPKCRKNAVWCVGIDVEKELWDLSIAVGTGGSAIFQPATGVSGEMFNTLMGRPVVPMEQMAALGTVGDIVLMDPTWIVMADKSMKTDISIHCRFIYDEQILRMVYRYDLQPILASAITPASGGDTLSSHVALETRS
jgi:HK97 family phage major capsid protein